MQRQSRHANVLHSFSFNEHGWFLSNKDFELFYLIEMSASYIILI